MLWKFLLGMAKLSSVLEITSKIPTLCRSSEAAGCQLAARPDLGKTRMGRTRLPEGIRTREAMSRISESFITVCHSDSLQMANLATS